MVRDNELKDSRVYNLDKYLLSLSRSDILVHSDGSVGSRYFLFQLGYLINTVAQSLGNFKEVYDAEIHATVYGVKAVINLSVACFAKNRWVFVGNQEETIKIQYNIPCYI